MFLPCLLVGCFALSVNKAKLGAWQLLMPTQLACSTIVVQHTCLTLLDPPVQVGEMTAAPVKTQFGHHLILCEGRKQKL